LTTSPVSVVDYSGDLFGGGVGFDYGKRFSAALSSPGPSPPLTNLELSLNPGTLFLAIVLFNLRVVLKSRHELLGDNVDLLSGSTAFRRPFRRRHEREGGAPGSFEPPDREGRAAF
jgi:hypothetical protein